MDQWATTPEQYRISYAMDSRMDSYFEGLKGHGRYEKWEDYY